MARVSDAFPALVSVTVCSACGKVPELCGCDSLRFCGVCWLLLEHCYCDGITIYLDEDDIELIDPGTARVGCGASIHARICPAFGSVLPSRVSPA